jgi:hypothetical protein
MYKCDVAPKVCELEFKQAGKVAVNEVNVPEFPPRVSPVCAFPLKIFAEVIGMPSPRLQVPPGNSQSLLNMYVAGKVWEYSF